MTDDGRLWALGAASVLALGAAALDGHGSGVRLGPLLPEPSIDAVLRQIEAKDVAGWSGVVSRQIPPERWANWNAWIEQGISAIQGPDELYRVGKAVLDPARFSFPKTGPQGKALLVEISVGSTGAFLRLRQLLAEILIAQLRQVAHPDVQLMRLLRQILENVDNSTRSRLLRGASGSAVRLGPLFPPKPVEEEKDWKEALWKAPTTWPPVNRKIWIEAGALHVLGNQDFILPLLIGEVVWADPEQGFLQFRVKPEFLDQIPAPTRAFNRNNAIEERLVEITAPFRWWSSSPEGSAVRLGPLLLAPHPSVGQRILGHVRIEEASSNFAERQLGIWINDAQRDPPPPLERSQTTLPSSALSDPWYTRWLGIQDGETKPAFLRRIQDVARDLAAYYGGIDVWMNTRAIGWQLISRAPDPRPGWYGIPARILVAPVVPEFVAIQGQRPDHQWETFEHVLLKRSSIQQAIRKLQVRYGPQIPVVRQKAL